MQPSLVWTCLKTVGQVKKHGSLYWLLDETKTAMGMRLLRTWIDRPLIDLKRIENRQAVVQVFLDYFFERSDLVEALKGVYDIERLASRVSFGKTMPKDLLAVPDFGKYPSNQEYLATNQ